MLAAVLFMCNKQKGVSTTSQNYDVKRNKLHGFSPQANYTQPSDRLLSAKLVPTFTDRRCRVVRATDPHGCILCFLDLKIAMNYTKINVKVII
jgi:hypothetical protein